MIESEWQTLPLFGDRPRAGVGARRESPSTDRTALNQVLHVYWSASVEAHALAALARTTAYPDERRGLLRLLQLEEERKAVAAELLDRFWAVRLPRSADAMPQRAASDSTTAA
jgi:hypothetical protein